MSALYHAPGDAELRRTILTICLHLYTIISTSSYGTVSSSSMYIITFIMSRAFSAISFFAHGQQGRRRRLCYYTKSLTICVETKDVCRLLYTLRRSCYGAKFQVCRTCAYLSIFLYSLQYVGHGAGTNRSNCLQEAAHTSVQCPVARDKISHVAGARLCASKLEILHA